MGLSRNCELIGPTPVVGVALVRAISEPFDAGQTVEVKLSTSDPKHVFDGEIYLRIPATRAGDFAVGDAYAVKLERF